MKLLPLEIADAQFAEEFGAPASAVGEASGRVNLIGEHTDYNGGFVLPTAIPQRTRALVRPRDDRRVRALSVTLDRVRAEFDLGHERATHGWADYLQGVTHVLGSIGARPKGFDVWIESEVPIGSGLSSSAALEVALFRALREAFQIEIDDMTIAKLCQRVENEFVGARVGIMDPVAASFAEPGIAIFLDTRSLEIERIALPMELVDFVVISSGISHRNVGGGYNTRRSECEAACALLGVSLLRDVDVSQRERLESLPDPLKRRARHVVTENARVLAAVDAIKTKDVERLGKLFIESHASMRDDYEVSIPEIDLLVELALKTPGVLGARLTGGGFGGSIVILSRKNGFTPGAICAQYEQHTGVTPRVLVAPA